MIVKPWCALRSARVPFLSLVCALSCASAGLAQMGPTFSVDWQGPSNFNTPGPFTGVVDGFGIGPIDEGSILTTALPGPLGPNPPLPGPLPAPGLMVGAAPGAAGSLPGGLGIVPFPLSGAVELDALSYGRDIVVPRHQPGQLPTNSLFFSVDEFAIGQMPAFAPDVGSEGVLGAAEASADVFRYLGAYGPVPGLIPPGPWNVDSIDGDGFLPFGGPGTGLIEANPPTPGDFGLMDPGDNLDAVDVNTAIGDFPGPIYFSLDSNFPDFLETAGMPGFPNNATALANGFVGGDVLVGGVGGFPAMFIPAITLGLDLFGADTDDLDALALMENGDGVGTPGAPGSGPAGLDEIVFSVRRGSAIIGMPDSAFGIPIEEGDILTVPTAAGATPSIFIFAEQLGLATVRSGTGFSWGIGNPNYQFQDIWGDDLDAVDVVPEPTGGLLVLIAAAGLAGRRRRKQV
jgi:hypothetical protein